MGRFKRFECRLVQRQQPRRRSDVGGTVEEIVVMSDMITLIQQSRVRQLLFGGGIFVAVVLSPILFSPSGTISLSTAEALSEQCQGARDSTNILTRQRSIQNLCTINDLTPECTADPTQCTEEELSILALRSAWCAGPDRCPSGEFEELQKRFGCRVYKVPVHAGLTCPNRDGTLGTEGCLYCGPSGSAADWSDSKVKISNQLQNGITFARKRFHAEKFIAYFQPYTNTYGTVQRLKRFWDEALEVKDVIGLSVGTRPDCLPDEVLDLIQSYKQSLPYLCLEVGLQSAHDRTLQGIHRGHDFACFKDTVLRAQERGIPICVHIMLGLPGESVEEMMETVRILLDMGIEGIKLHHLHILRGSPWEQDYQQGKIRLFDMEEYVRLVCNILGLISGRMVIHRFMGETPARLLVAPAWTQRKGDVLEAISRELSSHAI